MSSSTKTKKPSHVINPFEQLKDFASDVVRKAPTEVAKALIPTADMWGSPTPKPEQVPGGPNFSPVDFAKLQGKYQEQDNPDIDAVRQQLKGMKQGGEDQNTPQMTDEQLHMNRHRQFKREEKEYYLRRQQEEAEKERQEELARQQQDQEDAEAAKAAQQQSAPQGKVRKNILGGGHKKANMDLPPEVRHERKGGAGKH